MLTTGSNGAAVRGGGSNNRQRNNTSTSNNSKGNNTVNNTKNNTNNTKNNNTKLVSAGTTVTAMGGPRPRTSAVLNRRRMTLFSNKPSSSRSRGRTSSRGGEHEDFELLEFEWPDLPPITQIKDAITRSRVCEGMSYILPVDKGRNSTDNVFRTDLRYMFREPYRNDLINYNEEKVQAGKTHHFVPNKPAVPFKQTPVDYTKYKLNAESEKVRTLFSYSAPPRGIVGKETTADSPELRTRSGLFLPIKTKLPPEAIRMKEEAQKILQSVEKEAERQYDHGNREQSTVSKDDDKSRQVSFDKTDSAKYQVIKKAGLFKTYEDLKKVHISEKSELPEDLKSPFLSEQKNADVWDWLSKDEVVSDFNFFMKVCS